LILKQLIEGTGDRALVFEFPDDWETLKYDQKDGFYDKSVQKCQGTKAIDFLVLENNRQLWIEVKNFRGDAAANQLRLSPTENDVPGLVDTRNFVEEKQWKDQITVSRKKVFIADEIAQKVRDTCAGVLGATLRDVPEFQPFSIALQNKLPVHIILFLQQDEERDQAVDFRGMAQRIADKIRQQLGFMNATVEVINQYTLSEHAQWRL
jgi:hypothetical protein